LEFPLLVSRNKNQFYKRRAVFVLILFLMVSLALFLCFCFRPLNTVDTSTHIIPLAVKKFLFI